MSCDAGFALLVDQAAAVHLHRRYPKATRASILKVVDADEPPLRIFFGKVPLGVATADYESRLATWNEWQPISVEAHGSE